MEQSNIPAGELKRIEDQAKTVFDIYYPSTQYPLDFNSGRIYKAMNDCAKNEYLHSLQQLGKVHLVYRGWDSLKLIGRVAARFKELIAKAWDWVSFYNGWLEGRAEMLHELQEEWDAPEVPAPAGPVWVKASERTPIVGTEIYFEFAYPGDPIRKFTGYFLDLDGDQGFSAIVGRFYYLDKYAQYIRWLDESPSPRAASIVACHDCMDKYTQQQPIEFAVWAADRGWEIYPECTEDEEQLWYRRSNDILEPDEKVTSDQLYDLFLQSIKSNQ